MADEIWPSWLSGDQAEIEREAKKEQLGKVARALKAEIRKLGISDTGRMERAIRIDEEKGEVVVDVPYFEAVEYGRAPGSMPPYEAIRKWTQRKLGVSKKEEVHNVTWAIMMKIKQKGIKGRHILKRAWAKVTG